MSVATRFGDDPSGAPVYRVTLSNGGAAADVMTWGAILLDYRIGGVERSLVLGAPALAPYFSSLRYFGAIVGRVANRIAGGRALIDGVRYDFDRNENGRTTLHGGASGCADQNWRLVDHNAARCRLGLRLRDGLDGFPGDLDIEAAYALGDDGALTITMAATSSAPTLCNLAHHAYWNLDGSADVSDHRLTIAAERYLPVDAAQIPIGAPALVDGTRFDYRRPRAVASPGDGPLDHNFCLDGDGAPMRSACALVGASGLRLDVTTTEPGLQIYDGAGIDTGATLGHDGAPYRAKAGLAIEPQRWPDAPNQSDYPSIELRPGETYRQTSRFAARRADVAPT